jgi:hypothetical protein
MRKRVVVLAALVAVIGAVALLPSGASARTTSYGYVYLVTPHWWGWCPGISNWVTWVGWVDGVMSSGGDGGDDIVYARVNLNTWNTVVMAVQCAKTLPQGMTYSIYPTRNGQAFYFGYPAGVWHN